MGSIFDFNGIENCEQAIRKTWDEFRECLATGAFSYDEIEKAKKQKFLTPEASRCEPAPRP